jgi:hypothetical protein
MRRNGGWWRTWRTISVRDECYSRRRISTSKGQSCDRIVCGGDGASGRGRRASAGPVPAAAVCGNDGEECRRRLWRYHSPDIHHSIAILHSPCSERALTDEGRCGVGLPPVGATRVSMVQHFALRDNLADISAKAGSQEILCSLVGSLLGMIVTASIDDSAPLIASTFIIFTLLRISRSGGAGEQRRSCDA